jgi:hypothetical protein
LFRTKGGSEGGEKKKGKEGLSPSFTTYDEEKGRIFGFTSHLPPDLPWIEFEGKDIRK